jgi:hypothetical protein
MTWTRFWDMHSGSGLKEQAAHIYIEAPEYEARSVFFSRFGHDPDRVSCTCCGPDYMVSEGDDIAQLTAFHRGCAEDEATGLYVERWDGKSWAPYMTLDEYGKREDVLIILARDIEPAERTVDVPRQGYVWQD